MRKLMFLVLVLMLLIPAASAQDASEGVSVTIYNQGTALVRDRRSFELTSGLTTLDFTDIAASIDPTSVSFVSLTDPEGTVVLEQNYVYDLVGTSALLERYLDETIFVTLEDGSSFEGELLSGRGGDIILRDPSGAVYAVSMSKVISIEFPSLPDGLITRPTLRWLLQVAESGEQQVELTYLAGGMNWTADYIVLLNSGNTTLDLNGWVTLNNTSGATYRDALVKLVAGDVNRLPQVNDAIRMEMDMAVAQAAMPTPPVEQREFFEYQLYEIQRPVTIADNETKQVEFVTSAGVPASTYYVYNGSPGFYGYYGPISDRGYGIMGATDVQSWLEFSTDEDGGVGADLPAGRIRVYQEDIDGAALLIGENRIDHTPQGEKLDIFLGNAFDLVGERTQTDFQIIGRNVIEETYEIRLRNRKDNETVEIRIPETLFRWSNWEILDASDEYTRLNSSTIEFRVQVEPGQEKVVTYTVRYTWQ